MTDTHTLLHVLAGLLIVVGLLGTVLPVLPGLPVMFAGMLLAAWNDGFQRIGTGTLVVLGVLTAVSIAGGYTFRAEEGGAAITRQRDGQVVRGRATQQTLVLPGDTVYVYEDWFGPRRAPSMSRVPFREVF